MTVLQEPVQVKTHLQFVVMSWKPTIYEACAAFSVPASAAGPVRGVSSPPAPQAPQPAAGSTERFIGVIVFKIAIITVWFGLPGVVWVKTFNTMLVRC